MSNRVLLLQEVNMHPNSVLDSMRARFEKPSILHIQTKDGLKPYVKRPIFDDEYLVLFDSVKIFEANLPFLKLDFMLPVVHCTSRGMLNDAKELCKEKEVEFKVYVNAFERDDARKFIRGLASSQPSDNFCDDLIRRVGLSPQRIISAIMVCEQVGYKTSNISKYIDKYIYIDVYDVLESLLGVSKSEAQRKRARLYLHMNRLWYNKFSRQTLCRELDILISIYMAMVSGELTSYTIRDYAEEHGLSMYKVLYASNLFERVSLNDLMILKNFLSAATVLEVAMKLP